MPNAYNRQSFENLIREKAANQTKLLMKDLVKNLGETTPKDDGNLVNNWYFSINSPTNKYSEVSSGSASSMVSRESAEIDRITMDENSLHLTNNTPYAHALEFGNEFITARNYTRLAIQRTRRGGTQ